MRFKHIIYLFLTITIVNPNNSIASKNDSDWISFGMFRPVLLPHANSPKKGLFRFGTTLKVIDVDPTDFYKDGKVDPIHTNHVVGRNETVFSLFYGLTNNIVLIAKLPYISSFSAGSINPSGVKTLNLNIEGSAHDIGDISLTLKKRWLKQSKTSHFSFATISGLTLPTGSNDNKWDDQLVIGREDSNGVINYEVGFGGGDFTRFSDDGRLAPPLQSGIGALSGSLGFVFTKLFYRFPGAIHIGSVAQYKGKSDGISVGHQFNYFASYFKTIYKQYIIFELAVNGVIKQNDEYDGTYTHPVADENGNLIGSTTSKRPSFKGGKSIRFTPGLLLSPKEGFRFTASYSLLLNNPNLGPWAKDIYQMGVTYEF